MSFHCRMTLPILKVTKHTPGKKVKSVVFRGHMMATRSLMVLWRWSSHLKLSNNGKVRWVSQIAPLLNQATRAFPLMSPHSMNCREQQISEGGSNFEAVFSVHLQNAVLCLPTNCASYVIKVLLSLDAKSVVLLFSIVILAFA